MTDAEAFNLDYSPFPVKCTEKPCSYENLSISDFSLKK